MALARVDLSSWDHVRVEAKGASEKVWLQEPEGSSSRPESHWLFKPAKHHGDGSRQLGDWAEATAAVIARAIDVPAAEAMLGERRGVEGVATRNVRPVGYDMVTGRMVMLDEIEVETRDSMRKGAASIGHSLENVRKTLERYHRPPGSTSWEGCSAFDVLAGFLVLDALIANSDRHEQNWSVLRSVSAAEADRDSLAPAYDMEASLGFQLRDEARERRLRDAQAMVAYAEKGLARCFDGDQKTSLVELARRAWTMSSECGKGRLESLVETIATADTDALVPQSDGVSEVARTFAVQILRINGRRIEHAFGG